METCVLIPQEFSLCVRGPLITSAGSITAAKQRTTEPEVSVWSNSTIAQGALCYPFQGTIRLDKLEVLKSALHTTGDPQEECTNCGKMYLCTGASPPQGVCGACRGGGEGGESPDGDGDTPPHQRQLDEEEETCSEGEGPHTDEENQHNL